VVGGDGAESCRHKPETVCSLTPRDVWLWRSQFPANQIGPWNKCDLSRQWWLTPNQTKPAREFWNELAGRNYVIYFYYSYCTMFSLLRTGRLSELILRGWLRIKASTVSFLLACAQDGEGQRNTTPVEFYVRPVQQRKEFSTASLRSRTRAADDRKKASEETKHTKNREHPSSQFTRVIERHCW